MTIENVLVPTDFSLLSKVAVNYGVALARKFRAKLTLIHVIDIHPLLGETTGINREAEEELLQRTAQQLSALVSPEDEDDLDLRTVVKFGSVHREIVDTIREQKSDFIVLGTHGRGRVGRLILGSTTERLLRKLPIPVLTVRITGPLNFKSILFATDLSESSLHGFDLALDLALKLQSKIVAVHALDKTMESVLENNVVAEVHERATHEARRRLDMLLAEGRRNGIEVETVLVEGAAAPAILRASEKRSVDLILLPISKKGSLERALFGATAEQVVRESNIPVLCIPGQAMVEQRPGEQRRRLNVRGKR